MYALILIVSVIGPGNQPGTAVGTNVTTVGKFQDLLACQKALPTNQDWKNNVTSLYSGTGRADRIIDFVCVQAGH